MLCFLGGGDSDLMDENKDNFIMSLSYHEKICSTRLCFEKCFSHLHGFMKHNLKAKCVLLRMQPHLSNVNHWTVFQSTGDSLGTLYRGRVPKPSEMHSGIQTRNFLNQRTMHYPILLLSANFTIILWKYNNTLWWSHSIMETGENLKYSSCTNHLRFLFIVITIK